MTDVLPGMLTPPLVVPPAPALPPVPPTPPVPGTPAVSPVLTEVPLVPAVTLVVVVAPPQESITAASATVTPILATMLAIIRPCIRWHLSLVRNHGNAIALKSKNAKPKIVTISCVNGGEDGALSRGSLDGMAPAGRLKTCTVNID